MPFSMLSALFVLLFTAATSAGGLKKVEPPKESISASLDSSGVNTTKDEHDLFDDLFATYNNQIRPDPGNSITMVFFELSLFNLLRVDTKRQSIMTNTEIIMKWSDRYLNWDPADYGGITSIRVPYERIWYPDIILQNTASASYEDGILNTNAIIDSSGIVELTSHAVLDSICMMDIQWYPFDQQTCVISFASWTYDTFKVRLIPGPADLSEYSQNPEFFLEDFYRTLQDLHNPCCPLPVSTIKYHLQIQRRTIFSLFFFLMPGILINICALMVFSLPSESGEKVGLGINSMLAMMVFLMAMTERLPPTEKLPLAGVYYGACISMITFNICFTVLVLNLNVMGMRGYQVPHIIRVVTLFVARTILVRIPKIVKAAWDLDENNRISSSSVEPVEEKTFDKKSKIRLFTVKPSTPQKIKPAPEVVMRELDENISVAEIKDPFQRRTVLALESINRILSREQKETAETNRKNNLVDEWKFVSRVMDRTLFITFTIVCVIFNLTILTSSPFRERFSYCPTDDCEGLTPQEIMKLTANSASAHHFKGGTDHGGGDGGHGGGALAAAHLRSDPGNLVSLQEVSNSIHEDNKDHGGPKEQKRPGPLQRPFEAFPTPTEPEQFYVANPGPRYEGYEGLGLLPSPDDPALGRRRGSSQQRQPPGSAAGG